ncbi:hypothetical protein EDB85DRAFT_1897854 [Lactarius pseudohatsudake]|nr:hypothetical protein EDB85DRAFT_1897854 [Lactarius pseudohatsudake]
MPTLIHPKPRIFFNVTPIHPTGLTQVDLGEVDEDEESTRTRYSSLPPTPTRAEHNLKEARHQSLPPLTGDTEPPTQLPSLEEVDENDCSAEEMESPFTKDGNSTKDGAGTSSETGAVQNDARLRASHGAIIPRSITGIKKEAIKTCWFMLELGDLFINQFYSARHGAQVLQVWLLVPKDGSKEYIWQQVRENEKTYHPKLKNRTWPFSQTTHGRSLRGSSVIQIVDKEPCLKLSWVEWRSLGGESVDRDACKLSGYRREEAQCALRSARFMDASKHAKNKVGWEEEKRALVKYIPKPIRAGSCREPVVERGHAVHGECGRRIRPVRREAPLLLCCCALVGTMDIVIINLRKERGVVGTSEEDLAKRGSCCWLLEPASSDTLKRKLDQPCPTTCASMQQTVAGSDYDTQIHYHLSSTATTTITKDKCIQKFCGKFSSM